MTKKGRYIVAKDRHWDGITMNLRNISRISYKLIHDGKEIPMNDEEEIIFLHINDENDIKEDLIDKYEAEYMFMTEKMGWKDNTTIESRGNYLFLKEQMN